MQGKVATTYRPLLSHTLPLNAHGTAAHYPCLPHPAGVVHTWAALWRVFLCIRKPRVCCGRMQGELRSPCVAIEIVIPKLLLEVPTRPATPSLSSQTICACPGLADGLPDQRGLHLVLHMPGVYAFV